MKNKKKSGQNNKIIIVIIILVIFFCSLIIYLNNNTDEIGRELKKEGYTTENEAAFYKKVVTNNTLDDFYNDISKEKNSKYEEYYFSKESYEFIELKMSYQDDVTTNLNISSDLKTENTTFNYELSYKDVYLLLEGENVDDYTCKIVSKENIDQDTINTYCEVIKSEIKIFKERKTELLNNEKIKEIVNSPIKQYNEE